MSKVQEKSEPKRSVRPADLRLLMVFDALMREGSVARAAASMGLQSPAVSRMLGQLREIYGDPLFLRTGKGLRPTPLADSVRLRLRALATEVDSLFAPAAVPKPAGNDPSIGWEGPALIEAPPLAVQPNDVLEGAPTPISIATKLAGIGHNANPQRRLAKYIATTCAGQGHSRPLAIDEAEDALGIILRGEADLLQIGALLSTLQFRGATATELAGFIRAARLQMGAQEAAASRADLDWPAYISPKVRTAPWFIQAARLVASAGYRVLLHGHFGAGSEAGKLELAAQLTGIPVCSSIEGAERALDDAGIAYMPLAAFAPQLQRLIGLYPLLEMRLPINAMTHLLNPLSAPAVVLGVSRASSQDIQRDTAKLLGIPNLAIVGNTRDIAQFAPFRPTVIHRLVDGEAVDTFVPMRPTPARLMPTGMNAREYWHAVWRGAARDEAAETVIVTTAAVALMALKNGNAAHFDAAVAYATELWKRRAVRTTERKVKAGG
ncbi:anthranilate phosphoribosyltransferase [Rhizobium subbaraonis]|uniref:Anthranilate phosphoribosyltransferase n=1 Tax=Rhizobium subbaraonis TaxID=908946 RepID=A0A285UTT8_9HYPH|nr:glycosyl transferase family protein [Rhizobium subbaraonis]SOC45260.1 anthranilate phosphoribosyltransferase [Rhizobium subbaraonis]